MSRTAARFYESTELTFRAAVSKGGRWLLATLAWGFALFALISGLFAIPKLLGQFDRQIQKQEAQVGQFSSEVRGLLNQMHQTIQLSETQSRRLETLRQGTNRPSPSSSSPVREKYAVDPVTGIAIIDYSQIRRP